MSPAINPGKTISQWIRHGNADRFAHPSRPRCGPHGIVADCRTRGDIVGELPFLYDRFTRAFGRLYIALLCWVTVSFSCYGQPTNIRIEAVPGILYSVNWVLITYRAPDGSSQELRRDSNINAGQFARFTVPEGSTHIVLEAKPLASLSDTRIFNNLSLESGRDYCFELTGSVNRPVFTSVNANWQPGGRVSVFDNVLNTNVGLKGVKVDVKSARRLSTIGTTYTDDNGRFRLDSRVNGAVKYKVTFQDEAGMKVKRAANSHAESVTFQARDRSLNHVFRETDRKDWYWATIFNACRFYKEYASQENLPVKNNVQVCGYYSDGTSTAPMTGIQDVILRLYDRNSEGIFSVVMHEMAHMTHAQVDRAGYASFVGSWGLVNTLRAAFGESWACGPQAIFTNRRYNPSGNELNAHQGESLDQYTYAAQGGNRGRHLYIRPIVIDLMDNHNQRRDGNHLPVDNVSGYTLRQIARALKGAHNLDDWRDNLKRVNNPTNVHLDEYFNQYFEDRTVRTASNTIITIKAVSGIGYTVDWVKVSYVDSRGTLRTIDRNRNISLGQEATITVPDGASDIWIEAKPLASFKRTRIFNRLSLASGQSHCFHLKGSVNKPKYERVDCGS